MVRSATEDAIRMALVSCARPLASNDVIATCEAVRCSRATFYRSKAYRLFEEEGVLAAKATPGTKNKIAKLNGTIKTLANCVQALALRVEKQDQELAVLRQRTNDNVTSFPKISQLS